MSSTDHDARVAWHRLPRIVLADDPPLRIELPTAEKAEMTILGPGRHPIPEPLGQALAATTETGGRVTIAGLSPAAVGAVRVAAPGFGTQLLQIPGFPFPGFPFPG